jgi:hypothetical protein
MSIADLDNVGGDNVADLYHIAKAPRTAHCFLCAQRLDRIAVYWEGGERFEQQILLHADCAQKLALRLVEDGHKAGLIEKGRSIYVGVVPSLRPVEIPQARLVGITQGARSRRASTAGGTLRTAAPCPRQSRLGKLA